MTGLIGSGKSVAGKMFSDLGVDVIDTDIIAHQLTKSNGAAMKELHAAFGDEFLGLNGELNRFRMRELVFSDRLARRKLESILHPIIFDEVLSQIEKSSNAYLIVMVPLLFRSIKYINLIHRSIFIDCEEDILINRVVKRNGISSNEVKNILQAQMPAKMQLMLCDDCLNNNKNITILKNQIIKLNNYYQKIFTDVTL
jgi:dephospho-CoA kinase